MAEKTIEYEHICFVVMCGLPASGKTYLVEQIQKQEKDSNVVHICYDDILIHFTDIDRKKQIKDSWKSSRESIISAMKCCFHRTEDCATLDETGALMQKWCRTNLVPLLERETCCIIIIDDNMYYRSMRYSYYKLAKSLSACFCQIFVECSLAVSLERNLSRALQTRVPSDVIERMAARLEPPDPSTYHWERNTVTLNHDYSVNKLNDIFDFIRGCLRNPITETRLEDERSKEESRRQNSANLLHQVDQILRQLVSTVLKSAAKEQTRSDMTTLSCEMHACKQQMLEEIRSGCLHIPRELSADLVDASKDSDSILYRYVSKLFHSKIS